MPSADFRSVFNPVGNEVFIPRSARVDSQPIDSSDRLTQRRNSFSDRDKSVVSIDHREQQAPGHCEGCRQSSTEDDSNNKVPHKHSRFAQRRHYLAETIKNQRISLNVCAKRLGITKEEALAQIDPDSNLTLQQLFDWSEVLEVPIAELLPFDAKLSDPIRNRALLLRVMKTARQIQRISKDTPVEFVAATLVAQLLELAPDFATVEAWPSVGKSRLAQSPGLAARRIDSETSRMIEDNS